MGHPNGELNDLLMGNFTQEEQDRLPSWKSGIDVQEIVEILEMVLLGDNYNKLSKRSSRTVIGESNPAEDFAIPRVANSHLPIPNLNNSAIYAGDVDNHEGNQSHNISSIAKLFKNLGNITELEIAAFRKDMAKLADENGILDYEKFKKFQTLDEENDANKNSIFDDLVAQNASAGAASRPKSLSKNSRNLNRQETDKLDLDANDKTDSIRIVNE